ncbi:dephospho-CoA kinase [Conchiformibius steedae]|uniref:Dephospho-CoA kinase n=1 Tax=Conchiformibius steedae TaxID=153493 RepID=A0A3P2A4N4_9NEIS|nr:dephospho-CoA kinase [Conchiformibius steedae]RRD89868.1 dephospho-CoA kinase [Conchiformibius steedae]
MTAWIALTGGIGSGKSQAAIYFKSFGVPVIDADAVNRHLISTAGSPALHAIARSFGGQMLDENGLLRRDKMRQLIFTDPAAKLQLEHILHPLIIAQIRTEQARSHAVYGLVELPTLTEHPHFRPLVQRVLLIHSDEHVRLARVMQRNGLSEAEVRAIIVAQADDASRFALADDTIPNHGSPQDLAAAVARQHQNYLQRYAP